MRAASDRAVVLAREELVRRACARALEFCDVRFLREGAGWRQIRPLLPLRLLVVSTSCRDWPALLNASIQHGDASFPILVVSDPHQREAVDSFARTRPGLHVFVRDQQDDASCVAALVHELEQLRDGSRATDEAAPATTTTPPPSATPLPSATPFPAATPSPAVTPSGPALASALGPEELSTPGLEHIEDALHWLRSRLEGLMADHRAVVAERDEARDRLRGAETACGTLATQVQSLQGELAAAQVRSEQLLQAQLALQVQLQASQALRAELEQESDALRTQGRAAQDEARALASQIEEIQRQESAEWDALAEWAVRSERENRALEEEHEEEHEMLERVARRVDLLVELVSRKRDSPSEEVEPAQDHAKGSSHRS